jgi:hypothetical protein
MDVETRKSRNLPEADSKDRIRVRGLSKIGSQHLDIARFKADRPSIGYHARNSAAAEIDAYVSSVMARMAQR